MLRAHDYISAGVSLRALQIKLKVLEELAFKAKTDHGIYKFDISEVLKAISIIEERDNGTHDRGSMQEPRRPGNLRQA